MNITNENYKEFKESYSDAVKNNKEIFIFHEVEVLTDYAKYLIEYVESKKVRK